MDCHRASNRGLREFTDEEYSTLKVASVFALVLVNLKNMTVKPKLGFKEKMRTLCPICERACTRAKVKCGTTHIPVLSSARTLRESIFP